MDKDLWSFKNVDDLEKNIENYPDTILREQIDLLSNKTGFIIYGKPVFMKVENEEIKYDSAILFDILIPDLDNYRKTILIMYFNMEKSYPVAVTVGTSYSEDMESFNPKFESESVDDFTEKLRGVLNSSDVMGIVSTLYSKARSVYRLSTLQ